MYELEEKFGDVQFEHHSHNGPTWTKMTRRVIYLVESAHTEVRPDALIGLERDICRREMASLTLRIWSVVEVAVG